MKCKHETGEIEFGDVFFVDTEEIKIRYKELCQKCGKEIDKGAYRYTRKD